MERSKRPSDAEIRLNPEEEVIRLPVEESERSGQLEEMPTPRRPSRLRPRGEIGPLEDEERGVAELLPADPGGDWEGDQAETHHRNTPMGWLVLIGLSLVLLGGWALVRLLTGEAYVEAASNQVRIERDLAEQERREAVVLLERAEQAVAGYLGATSVEEMASFVRHRERVLPLMRHYYRTHPIEPVEMEGINDFHALSVGRFPFVFVSVQLKGEEEARSLFMEQLPGGELKFDWESEVGYLPMDPAEYIREKPTAPMDFRVYARLDTFHGYEFMDRERYQALLLTFRDSEEFIFGYVEKGTSDERFLTEFLGRDLLVAQPVYLRLRFLPDTRSRRSVLVEKLVAPRWVHIDNEEEG